MLHQFCFIILHEANLKIFICYFTNRHSSGKSVQKSSQEKSNVPGMLKQFRSKIATDDFSTLKVSFCHKTMMKLDKMMMMLLNSVLIKNKAQYQLAASEFDY